ncbi:MAG: hypothetical protein J1G04_00780 [Clostridiales bacterium]|nr:hypothetical protein [Clostridiales bacterium]
MKHKRSLLTDSDKIFITVALWISMIALFATALTLPMLPDMVTIFYKTTDMEVEYYSKYNNLLIVFVSIFPAMIMIVAGLLRRFGKMQHNFQSITLFCIVLSGSLSGICIYGIMQQFDASNSVRSIDTLNMISLCISAVISIFSSLIPTIVHTPSYKAGEVNRSARRIAMDESLDKYWNVAAYGFLCTGIVGVFITGALSFIPVAAYFVACIVFLIVVTAKQMKHNGETVSPEAVE